MNFISNKSRSPFIISMKNFSWTTKSWKLCIFKSSTTPQVLGYNFIIDYLFKACQVIYFPRRFPQAHLVSPSKHLHRRRIESPYSAALAWPVVNLDGNWEIPRWWLLIGSFFISDVSKKNMWDSWQYVQNPNKKNDQQIKNCDIFYIHHRRINSSPLKNSAWNMTFRIWDSAYFQREDVKLLLSIWKIMVSH